MSELDAAPLQQLVDQFAADRHCPSISWGVVMDGDLAATSAVGDVSEQTVFRIASMTKSFSAAATLALRDFGVLRLDDPVAFTHRNWRTRPIRLGADQDPRPAVEDQRVADRRPVG